MRNGVKTACVKDGAKSQCTDLNVGLIEKMRFKYVTLR